MDQPHPASPSSTQPLARRPKPKRIGFIGRNDINDTEAATLRQIGRAIARLGHTLVTVPTEGATARLREGVVDEEGVMVDLQTGVLEASDHTLLYPNPRLLARLREKYPALENEYKVTILQPNQLSLFWQSMVQIMQEMGMDIPA